MILTIAFCKYYWNFLEQIYFLQIPLLPTNIDEILSYKNFISIIIIYVIISAQIPITKSFLISIESKLFSFEKDTSKIIVLIRELVSFEISKEKLIEHDSALIDMLTASGFFSQKQEDLRYVFDVISLFSGAGLLDYPFKKDESFDIKFAIDFDKTACETYKNNIGDHILCMDIRDLDESRVPDTDVVIGGPCCQGYSNAIMIF